MKSNPKLQSVQKCAHVQDSEVGRENPAEHKAQKMARSVTRGLVDRALKPDTEEKRSINEILHYPPNRCGW